MTTTHTPGPWKADIQPGDCVVWGPGRDEFIANIGTGHTDEGTPRIAPVMADRALAVGAVAYDIREAANAQLIALAPELVDALRACVGSLDMVDGDSPALDTARALLSRLDKGDK